MTVTRETLDKILNNNYGPTEHTDNRLGVQLLWWEATDKHNQYSRQVAITYPRNSYYVFDKLTNGEWIEDSEKWQETYERALSTAQTLANKHRVPFRVREVVDL